MCDTLCAVGPHGAWFAKNSDRYSSEPQVVETLPRRPRGGVLHTQYLEIPDEGAFAILGSRPVWLWGLEHGVNEHGVAIGNERLWNRTDVTAPALLGMDLVRLGLERGGDATAAVEVIVELIERYGQGGIGERETGDAYSSSFLVVDPGRAWVLETDGRRWAAKRVERAAISNRVTLTTDWDRASADVAAGTDVDTWREPAAPVRHADLRLAASRACLAGDLTPRALATHLRDHGGETGMPVKARDDGTGVTVCMHLRKSATTASLIASLGDHLRAWVALANPCISVFVPVRPPDAAPVAFSDEATWQRFAALSLRVAHDRGALDAIRAVLRPVEDALWDDAADVTAAGWPSFVEDAWARVDAALRDVECAFAA